MASSRTGRLKQPSKASVRHSILNDCCPSCYSVAIVQGDPDICLNESIDSIYLPYHCKHCKFHWSTIFRAVGILPSHVEYETPEPFDDVYLSNWGVTAKHPASSIDDPLFDTKQAAEYLGLATHTMSVWRVSGVHSDYLPYIKVGSKVKYRKSALDAFLAIRTKGGAK